MPMRQIVVLFKGVDPRQLSDPGEQLKKVLEFKKRLEREKSFLFGTFDTSDEFGKHLQRQLWSWLADLEQNGEKGAVPPSGGPIRPSTLSDLKSPAADSDQTEENGGASAGIDEAKRLADQG